MLNQEDGRQGLSVTVSYVPDTSGVRFGAI